MNLDELKRLIAEIRKDRIVDRQGSQERLDAAVNALPDLIAEIERLRGGCPRWCHIKGRHGHKTAWTVHQDALKRIEQLEAKNRELEFNMEELQGVLTIPADWPELMARKCECLEAALRKVRLACTTNKLRDDESREKCEAIARAALEPDKPSG